MEGIYQEAHRRCSSPIRDLGFKTALFIFLANALFFHFSFGDIDETVEEPRKTYQSL